MTKRLGWILVQVSNQEELHTRLDNQQRIMLLVLGVTALVLLLLIITMTRNLMGSINRLVGTMKAAQGGRLSVRTTIDPQTPTEIQIIENQFNQMMGELERAAVKEKEAGGEAKKSRDCRFGGPGKSPLFCTILWIPLTGWPLTETSMKSAILLPLWRESSGMGLITAMVKSESAGKWSG